MDRLLAKIIAKVIKQKFNIRLSKKVKIIALIIISAIMICSFFFFYNYNKEQANINYSVSYDDIKINVTLPNQYLKKHDDTEYNLYVTPYDESKSFGFFVYEKEKIIKQEILEHCISSFMKEYGNIEVLEDKTIEDSDKIITNSICKGKNEYGSNEVWIISTIEFKEKKYILNVIQVSSEKYYKNNYDQLIQNLKNIKIGDVVTV